ncbi:MAG: coproporphyrinogen dehydrogenase HemZ [Anaerovoracaceae bacterium]
MYRCSFSGTDKINQYEELIKVFLQPDEYEIITDESPDIYSCDRYVFDGDKDKVKRSIYKNLQSKTGKSPKWGIITGIRPVKLAGEIYKDTKCLEDVKKILKNTYLLDDGKAELTAEILSYQLESIGLPERNSVSVYIGIPFCPTRCLYCSFTSNQVSVEEIERYLQALCREIRYAGSALKNHRYKIESLYVGGGTPTTLNEEQIEMLLYEIRSSFDLTDIKEFTVEAGRPDTITAEKLRLMKEYGAERVSINPQTMNEETLKLIGRAHNCEDVSKAFELAEQTGIDVINTDLIAGLPGETFDDFKNSLLQTLDFGADNITLHTLAVKRASKLKDMDDKFNYRNEPLREEMLSYALSILKEKNYRPYYLYRQKHTSGNTENIGFCRKDKVSIYNVRIMEEAQSILALGAGGISKVYFPDENRLERVANVSNYEIYIERIDEMIERKEKDFFME